MKRTDFDSPTTMRILFSTLYNGLRLARRLAMDVDIDRASRANQDIYRGLMQSLNTLIDLLKFEDEPE